VEDDQALRRRLACRARIVPDQVSLCLNRRGYDVSSNPRNCSADYQRGIDVTRDHNSLDGRTLFPKMEK